MENLSQKVQAVHLLLQGVTPSGIAEQLEVSQTNLEGWLKDPEFVEVLQVMNTLSPNESQRDTAFADIDAAREHDRKTRDDLADIVEGLGSITAKVIQRILENEELLESFGPASVHKLVSSTSKASKALQDSNDRVIGLENLINELSKIKASISPPEPRQLSIIDTKAVPGGTE